MKHVSIAGSVTRITVLFEIGWMSSRTLKLYLQNLHILSSFLVIGLLADPLWSYGVQSKIFLFHLFWGLVTLKLDDRCIRRIANHVK